MRQIVFDTETTGLDYRNGHRLIEIGCVELFNRQKTKKKFHTYINPQRSVDPEAFKIHGLSDNFLSDKPLFSDIYRSFLDFTEGSEIIAHNANFDIGFVNFELSRLPITSGQKSYQIDDSKVIDTLKIAKDKRPGKRNSLNALCKDFGIDTSRRQLHGALLDAELLAEVFLLLTRSQSSLLDDFEPYSLNLANENIKKIKKLGRTQLVLSPNSKETINHHKILAEIRKFTSPLWDTLKNE